MRSDHRLNPLSQLVLICQDEFSSNMDQWPRWFGSTPAWWYPFPSIPDTWRKRERTGRPRKDCWRLIQSMQVKLIQLWRRWDTKISNEFTQTKLSKSLVVKTTLTKVERSLLLLKNELTAPQTLSLTSTMSWITCSYNFSCDPLQFSALKMNFDTSGYP